MTIATVYICDRCNKSEPSPWAGEPRGWVRLEAEAKWDGNNYHIFKGEKHWSFCSIKCFLEFMQCGGG